MYGQMGNGPEKTSEVEKMTAEAEDDMPMLVSA